MADKDFFLSPDDAQTLGDINYMRMAKRVRKTFPKTLKNKDGFESITEVSSLEDRSNLFNGNGTSSSNSTSNFQSTSPESNGTSQESGSIESSKVPERAANTSMDMFRNMARKINKRR
jgi:hypothetical protein